MQIGHPYTLPALPISAVHRIYCYRVCCFRQAKQPSQPASILLSCYDNSRDGLSKSFLNQKKNINFLFCCLFATINQSVNA